MTMHGRDLGSGPEPESRSALEADTGSQITAGSEPAGDAGSTQPDPTPELPWPDLPLVVAGARLLDTQREAMREHLAAAVDGRDPEGVHQMRVASRRLRALLRLLGPLTDGSAQRRLERSLRRVARALGRVRELDVLRAALAEMLTTADSAHPARALALEAVDGRAQRRQRRARAAMIRRFAAVDMDRLDRQLTRLAATLQARRSEHAPIASHFEAFDASPRGAPAADGMTIPDVPAFPPTAAGESLRTAVAATAPALATVARAVLEHPLPAETGTPDGLAALHEIRIGVKRLRYGIEVAVHALQPSGRRRSSGGKSLLRELKALQESLGELHDDAVLADELARGAERAARRGQPRAAAALRNLLASRRRALLRDERRARSELQRLTHIDFATTLEHGLTQPPGPAATEAETMATLPLSEPEFEHAAPAIDAAATPESIIGSPDPGGEPT